MSIASDAGDQYLAFDDHEAPSLGSCCICGVVGPAVVNILTLDRKSPVGGRGWGCLLRGCDLPADGAVAVVCTPCIETVGADGQDIERTLVEACRGWPGQDGRVPIGELVGEHRHDEAAHRLDDAVTDGDEDLGDPLSIHCVARTSSCGTTSSDAGDDLDAETDSHLLGERACRYVDPTFIHLPGDEDLELLQCALCSRFFLQAVPIRLFQDLGGGAVLGFAICEGCAPRVMARMSSARGQTGGH
jgi:hypothetical protein